jgi:hypothetical protein
LPEKLKKLAQDSAGTAKRRDYVAQLKFLYGKDVFVTDIVATVLELSKTQSNKFINEFYYRALTSTGSVQAKMCKIFCLSLVSKIMTDLDSISVFLDYIPHENLKKITGKVKDPAIVELLYKVVPNRLLK